MKRNMDRTRCPLCTVYKSHSSVCRACDGTGYIPIAVEGAIRNRYPDKAGIILSTLKWGGDHFYFMLGAMYVGVEKSDGHIHT